MSRGASFATSGAIVMSDVAYLDELLWPWLDGIEIGSFGSDADFKAFTREIAGRNLTWGLHAPLLRQGKTRQEITEEGMAAADLAELASDAARAKKEGALYAVTHTPYFASDVPAARVLAAGVDRTWQALASLSRTLGDFSLLLEFKLGRDRRPGILKSVLEGVLLPEALPGAGLCLDVGDWILAARALGVNPHVAVARWSPLVRVVHVHVVHLEPDAYWWAPIHPAADGAELVVELSRRILQDAPDVRFVFEHTPRFAGDEERGRDGALWFRDMLLSR